MAEGLVGDIRAVGGAVVLDGSVSASPGQARALAADLRVRARLMEIAAGVAENQKPDIEALAAAMGAGIRGS